MSVKLKFAIMDLKSELDTEHTSYIVNSIKVEDAPIYHTSTVQVPKYDEHRTKLENDNLNLLHIKEEEIYLKDEIPASDILHKVTLQGMDGVPTDVNCNESDQLQMYCNAQSKLISNQCYKIEPTLNLKPFETSAQVEAKARCLKIHNNSTNNKSFACSMCGYKTDVKSRYTRHVKTHIGDKPFACNLCDYKSSQKANLTAHMMSHTGDKPFVCNLCDYRTSQKRNLTTHIRIHTGEKPYVCDFCDFKTAQKSNLKRHIQSHTGTHTTTTIQVPECVDEITTLKIQNEIYVKDEIPMSDALNSVTFWGINNDIPTQHVTEMICDKSDQTYSNTESKLTSSQCNERGSTSNLKAFEASTQIETAAQCLNVLNNITTRKKSFICNVCDYTSTSKSHFTVHLRTHTGEKPFACNLCDFKAKQKISVDNHMRVHTAEKPFVCNLCDFKTARKSYLKYHMSIHTGDKPFVCNLCDFKTVEKRNLTIHMRIHTGEKPYVCDLCDFKTAYECHLKRHIRTHTGEKPFACNFCAFKATQKVHIDSHMRTHTAEKPYACNLCIFKTARRSNLIRHMRVHTTFVSRA